MKRRLLVWLCLIVSIIGLPYSYGAWERSRVSECKRQIQPAFARHGSGSPAYVGEICFLGSNEFGLLFRLYDLSSGVLLAERSYYDTDVDMVWSTDSVIYNMGASPSGYVRLPPTWWDRLRAKLP